MLMLLSCMLIISSMLILLRCVYGIKFSILHYAINGFTYLFSLMYYRHGPKGRESHGFKGRTTSPPKKRKKEKKNRGKTMKYTIIRNWSRGIKLLIDYNADGIYVGESYVHITSYLGVLARTQVPIRYNTWQDVPVQLKDKL